jgi:hypothetical protein
MRLVKTLALVFFVMPLGLQAQSGEDHPLLVDKYLLTAGMFFPDKDLEVKINGTNPGDLIDFDERFKTGSSESTGSFNFRWRFGEKWELQGQYWTTSDSGSAVLEEDIRWEDAVLETGSFVGAGAGIDIARLFFGRKFSSGPNHEFGIGLGVHWLQLEAYVEGQALTNLGDTEFYRGAAQADLPLPNIGAWYTYAWSPKWALISRVDWLSASVGDYSGGLWNAAVGVNWAIFRNFGITASYNYFELDGDVKEDSWRGSVTVSQTGPFLALTASW